jgi:copper chaperone
MSQPKHVILAVQGMTCEGCVRAVERVVKRIDPAAEVSIDLASGRVELTTTSAAEKLGAAIDAAGYRAKLIA